MANCSEALVHCLELTKRVNHAYNSRPQAESKTDFRKTGTHNMFIINDIYLSRKGLRVPGLLKVSVNALSCFVKSLNLRKFEAALVNRLSRICGRVRLSSIALHRITVKPRYSVGFRCPNESGRGDCRTPKPSEVRGGAGKSLASWSAIVLYRFASHYR
jgi:hypothetical protein